MATDKKKTSSSIAVSLQVLYWTGLGFTLIEIIIFDNIYICDIFVW